MELDGALGLTGRELVAFVGAGGKKTAMQQLLDAGRERGLRVGYTTTTHMPPPADVPLTLQANGTPLDSLRVNGDAVALAAERVPNPERADSKVRGFDARTVDDIYSKEGFDWLLVKADGARRREFKAPGPDEPVVPSRTTHLVPVASVQAVGKPLDQKTVHRPERVAALTETAIGERISPKTIATILNSEEGGLKRAPASATVTPLLNKADSPELRETARSILSRALANSVRLRWGIIASFRTGYCHRFELDAE
jgi:probable selenium-dependent hydroxylase accessory protein YqeC